jgi:hypothetical protein
VSAFALGRMTFGESTAEEVAFAQLDAFTEVGGTLVDTADVYAGGVSETTIGKWLAARPAEVTDRVVLATKGRFPVADEPNGVGLSRRHLDRALNASLRRLAVDTIDLYQVHSWDPLIPIEETLSFLDTGAGGQGPLRRPVQRHRLAGAEDRRHRRRVRSDPAGDPATAVQPALPRDRVGDRARVRVHRGPVAPATLWARSEATVCVVVMRELVDPTELSTAHAPRRLPDRAELPAETSGSNRARCGHPC